MNADGRNTFMMLAILTPLYPKYGAGLSPSSIGIDEDILARAKLMHSSMYVAMSKRSHIVVHLRALESAIMRCVTQSPYTTGFPYAGILAVLSK